MPDSRDRDKIRRIEESTRKCRQLEFSLILTSFVRERSDTILRLPHLSTLFTSVLFFFEQTIFCTVNKIVCYFDEVRVFQFNARHLREQK